MKKSILMAIVALALLAAPAFAGDFNHSLNLDAGFGLTVGEEDAPVYNTLTDGGASFGLSGAIDDNNTLSFGMDLGGMDLNPYSATWGNAISSFNVTTNVLGAFGVTDVPVTLMMTNGVGRLELHNRYNQWTQWEYIARKQEGEAIGNWGRMYFFSFDVGIMDMVNVRLGFIPDFNQHGGGVNMLFDVWTNDIAVGPGSINVSAFVINQAAGYSFDPDNDPSTDNSIGGMGELVMGGEVNTNWAVGPANIMFALFGGYRIPDSIAADNWAQDNIVDFMVALKPSVAVGPATLALGTWFAMQKVGDADAIMFTAIDLSASIAMVTFFGGVKIDQLNDRADGVDMSDVMTWELGAKLGMGGTTLTVGINGQGESTTNINSADDMNAADGTTGRGGAPADTAVMYVRVQAALW
jgi:hypothetical protein